MPLRSETPSACSSRTVVASVNGRRPPSTFSSVERLSLACSAKVWREMRRRAISSRMGSATRRLWAAESCLSGVGILAPFESDAILAGRTIQHKTAHDCLALAHLNAPRLNKADHDARVTASRFALSQGSKHFWERANDDLR